MAKTGANIRPGNVRDVEKHNRRDKDYIDGVVKSGRNIYIFQDLTHLNQSSTYAWGRTVNGKFVADPEHDYSKCTVAQLFEHEKELYTKLVGRKPMLKDRVRVNKKTGREYTISGWSPIREAVIPVKADTTLEDFNKIKSWFANNGIHTVRIDIHHDEGYKAKDGTMKMNHHAHIVLDYLDHKTGKTNKLTLPQMSELQTVVADSLGMERGTPKAETGARHLSPAEEREKKALEHAEQAAKEAEKAKKNASDARKEEQTLNSSIQKKNAQILALNAQISQNQDQIHQQVTTYNRNQVITNRQTARLNTLSSDVSSKQQQADDLDIAIAAKQDSLDNLADDVRITQEQLRTMENSIFAKRQEIDELQRKIEMLKKTSVKNIDYRADLNKVLQDWFKIFTPKAIESLANDAKNTSLKHITPRTARLVELAIPRLDEDWRVEQIDLLFDEAKKAISPSPSNWVELFRGDCEDVLRNGALQYCQHVGYTNGRGI